MRPCVGGCACVCVCVWKCLSASKWFVALRSNGLLIWELPTSASIKPPQCDNDLYENALFGPY